MSSDGEVPVNRRKKVNQILKKKAKQRAAKLNPKSKSVYISKAERLALDANSVSDSSAENERC